jgi:hypothetical protein
MYVPTRLDLIAAGTARIKHPDSFEKKTIRRSLTHRSETIPR